MTTIASFRIERELGRGGMGVVYLARDTRLDRPVAIKALPEQLAADPDRLARFEREAKIVASLNHPGIAAVYALDEHEGRKYLVMEFVEGETLAARLKRGRLPVDEALSIAIRIAEALEAAHGKGIIHRDLKPGNVMLTSDGAVKVLDFGLARTADATGGGSGTLEPNSPTLTVTSPAHAESPTMPGAILGTAGYMSPEQVRGRPVDKRSDIFSFGCVLFEMLSGETPFRGETVADSIGATIHAAADLSRLSSHVPPAAARVLRRCLEKQPHHRLHDIADARIELEASAAETPTPPVRSRGMRRLGLLAAFVAGAACAVPVAVRWRRPISSAAGSVVRFAITETRMPNDAFLGIALSPDGRRLVYRSVDENGSHSLKVRSLDSLESASLSQGAEMGWLPFFSPDGGRVGFFTQGFIKQAALASGLTRTIVTVDVPPTEVPNMGHFAWISDPEGTIFGLWKAAQQ